MCFNVKYKLYTCMEKFGFEEAKTLIQDPYSCLQLINKNRDIILAPRFIGQTLHGICEQLNLEVNLYCDLLQGVLISYSNIKLLQPLSLAHDDKPHLHFRFQADYIVFQPFEGCMLRAVVNQISRDHVGCLVHRHFNASIPKYGDGTGKGSQLDQGDEITFKVTSVYSNIKVVFMKGTLYDERSNVEADVSLSHNARHKEVETSVGLNDTRESESPQKKKKKSRDIPLEEDSVISPKQKKKKRSRDTDISLPLEESSVISPKKKRNKRSRDTDISLPLEENSVISPKKKRKRKDTHSKDTDEDSGIMDNDINCSETTKIKYDIETDSASPVKKLRLDKSFPAEMLISSLNESQEETVFEDNKTKKHKKKKHRHKVDNISDGLD